MDEYSWPDNGVEAGARSQAAWCATCLALPVGTSVTGKVIGRQPFGVFITIDNAPDVIGLAEIMAMPRDAVLPLIGTRVSGEVIWHADHNYQVKIKLDEWKAST
ncbi:hypothetical protein OG709_02000 [Streptomyces sp. NBC_01267]|uniref:hypothetical protein n=1 Tax=unclassified Streptomyces TaxID=2593676 RepID=UPI0020252DAE|nr:MULTISPECIES: hypothetical protein [unclassified Streptomyces]